MVCSVIYPGPAWVRADPLALSDTVDNLRNAENAPYRGILNRSASAVLVHILFKGDHERVLPIPAHSTLPFGQQWVRAMVTGTTGAGHSAQAYETILTTGNGAAFTNQPANDGVEIVSSAAGDTTQSVIIYGTTNGTDTVVVETVALNGTTAVATVKVDWGLILGVELSASCAGTITVREASANQTITAITTGNLSSGVETVTAATQAAYNTPPVIVASGTSTKQLGLGGTNPAGTAIYDSQALTNTTALEVNSSFGTVTKVFTGDLEANRTATVSVSSDLMVFL